MRNIIENYLSAKKLKKNELTQEEQKTLDLWNEIFSQDVNMEMVAKFLETEIDRMHGIIKKSVLDGKDREALIATSRVQNYEAILQMIRQPEAEKESLKARIQSLID